MSDPGANPSAHVASATETVSGAPSAAGRYFPRDRRLSSLSTASRIMERASSLSLSESAIRTSVPSANDARNFSGNCIFLPISHIRYVDNERTITHIRFQHNGDESMAILAYFADLADGTTVAFKARREPTYVDRMGCQRYRVVEPKVQRCVPTDGTADATAGNVLCGYVEGRGWTRITRTVQMKASPSRHECDSRCMNASGRVMNCECACGGVNHGKGRFMCEAA